MRREKAQGRTRLCAQGRQGKNKGQQGWQAGAAQNKPIPQKRPRGTNKRQEAAAPPPQTVVGKGNVL